MNYDFPWITCIEQCLIAIEGHKEFIVAERDGHTIINYVMQDSDTFSTEVRAEDDAEWRAAQIRRECRGIVFDENRKILSRRLHKFFNVGEKVETMDIDLSQPHWIMEKVDGSMMTPLFIGGGIRWGTKMGVTEIAMRAEEFVLFEKMKGTMDYEGLAKECHMLRATPIFEWCDDDIRYQVVIPHKEKKLILLHIRDNVTGVYYHRDVVQSFGSRYHIPVVKTFSGMGTKVEYVQKIIADQEDAEGVVIMLKNGHMAKIKSDWYLILHRAKAAIEKERDVCAMIVDDSLDDMLPLQPETVRDRLLSYQHAIKQDIENFVMDVNAILRDGKYVEKKDFAIATKDWNEPAIRNCVFHLWPEKNGDTYQLAYEWAKKHLKMAASSADNFEKKARPILKTAIWKP